MTKTFKMALKATCILALGTSFFSGGSTTANAASVEVYVCQNNGEGHYEVSIISDRTTSARVSYVVQGGQNYLNGPFSYYHQAGQNWVVGQGFDFAYANGDGNIHDKNANQFYSCSTNAYNEGNNNNNGHNNQQAGGNLNIGALSLGGSLRSGPGMNHQKVGSIYGRAHITLLRNTGVHMNGYDWFEIISPKGQRVFQWGGIMCSPNQYVQGIYERCN